MPYAYHVMRKHGGSLHIAGKKGEGASVYLNLPKRSVRARFVGRTEAAVEAGKEASVERIGEGIGERGGDGRRQR
ncbi:hypothetical protein J19TS2_19280 [Cohnella xylanilytica]|nr:hypothetical protein J19TS2_19280 [Cohnella xylanilytica]